MKFTLSRIPLNNGGYDRTGRYFGNGTEHVYQAMAEVLNGSKWDDIILEFRAVDRKDAKEYVRGQYPDAEFYR